MRALADIIQKNVAAVSERVLDACQRAGRDSSSVTRVAVIKYAQREWIPALLDLGITELGESRPQQLVEREQQFGSHLHWHLIGQLQRNKIRRTLPAVSLIHSVDSMRLLEAIDRTAMELQLMPRVLLQVNISGELSKSGFDPVNLLNQWDSVLACRYVSVQGLMTMPPRTEDPESARPTFSALREYRERLVAISPIELTLPDLSMGMSSDFEIAIEEGATILRIGSRLLEGLPQKR